jgi:hypothetical protein
MMMIKSNDDLSILVLNFLEDSPHAWLYDICSIARPYTNTTIADNPNQILYIIQMH